MYTANDFNTANAPKEMVQYVIDNVEDFEPRNSRILLHLENNRVVPPSSQDVALCRYSVSGEVPL